MLQGLYTGLSSLISHRKALDVTSNNIANINTEGFTKQVVNFSTNPIKDEYNIQMGTGTHIQSVSRVHDEMLFNNMKNIMKKNSEFSESFNKLSVVNDFLKSEVLKDESILDQLEKFFESVQNIAAEPNSQSLKTISKDLAKNIEDKTNNLNNYLNKYQSNLKDEYSLLENQANSYLSQLEPLSNEIHNIEALNSKTTTKEYANDLRDKRDLLEEKLSEIGNFKSYKNSNISEYDTTYSFEFNNDGGKLKGISNTINTLNNLKKNFNNIIEPINNKIKDFTNGDMNNPNELIDWWNNNNTTKQLENNILDFSTNVDNIKTSLNSTETILNHLQQKHDNMSKVNLDEEMTNMIRYQRAYEANAKVIQTLDEILQTTIDLKK